MEVSSLPRARGGLALRTSSPRLLARLSDERLVEHIRGGNEAAFEVVFDRHHRGILGFCRHMLRSQEEAEDAVQQTFISAYNDLVGSDKPIRLKAWLYTIARNRCLSMLRSRRESVELPEELPTAGLSEAVAERDDLRSLLADVQTLPEDQRAALVLSELGDLAHAEIAEIVGCETVKVKALVFQARSSLIESKRARDVDCQEIREELATARGGALRRGTLRRHIRSCPGCAEFRDQVSAQRRMLALALPVIPTLGLKNAVLAGIGGNGAAAGGAFGGGALAGGGAAGSSGVAGGAAGAGGVSAATGGGVAGGGGLFSAIGTAGAAKVAVVAIVAAGGGAVAVHEVATHQHGSPSSSQAGGHRVPGGIDTNGDGKPDKPVPGSGRGGTGGAGSKGANGAAATDAPGSIKAQAAKARARARAKARREAAAGGTYGGHGKSASHRHDGGSSGGSGHGGSTTTSTGDSYGGSSGAHRNDSGGHNGNGVPASGTSHQPPHPVHPTTPTPPPPPPTSNSGGNSGKHLGQLDPTG